MFFGMFSFYIFEKLFAYYTADFGCLVLNNRERTNDFNKMLSWYKGQYPLPSWSFSTFQDMCNFHNKFYVADALKTYDWTTYTGPTSLKLPSHLAPASKTTAGKGPGSKGRGRKGMQGALLN